MAPHAHDKRLTLPATQVEPHFQCGCHTSMGLEILKTQRSRRGCLIVEIHPTACAAHHQAITQAAAFTLENEEFQKTD